MLKPEARPVLLSGWDRRGASVRISEERLWEFLKAEVSYFAGQDPTSISLKQILDASTPQRAAELSHTELPIRFAQRILQIESLPGWQSYPDLVEVHNLYASGFRDLRLVELDVKNLDPFTKAIKEMKGRMKGVIPQLASAMRKLQSDQGFPEAEIGHWLDTFLLSRIGTEMLTSQYIACTAPPPRAKGAPQKKLGIVDDACDPASICRRASLHVKNLCKQHYQSEQDIQIVIESCGAVRFPYVPQYLFYILVELLKNSARATVEISGGDPAKIRERPIIVTVGADPGQVAIRVHDTAGGIPFSVADRVWSYMYSTAHKDNEAKEFTQMGTPLAGFGVGLPLSRLYARYLGGSLHLLSLPGVGTRAYLYLKRLETEAREELPGPSLHSVADS